MELRPGNAGREPLPRASATAAVTNAAAPTQEASLATTLQSFRLDPQSSYTGQVEYALRDAIAFPSAVLGPVDLSALRRFAA